MKSRHRSSVSKSSISDNDKQSDLSPYSFVLTPAMQRCNIFDFHSIQETTNILESLIEELDFLHFIHHSKIIIKQSKQAK